jgi:PAS domain S-box-containing protein
VFTPVRTSVLKLLSSQMAISLENARLYADLSNENRDRRKAEDALREQEKLWRSLFENTLVGISLTDTHGRYVAANAAYQRMTGYSEAELVGLSPLEITYEEDRPASEAVLEAHALGRLHRIRLEKRFRTKTGTVVWTEVSASAVPAAGGTPLIAGFVVDITDRKRAEEDLRRSEAFLAQAQQISQTGSWRWNVATGEVGWSTEHFRIFGFDPAATQPSYPTFMERIEPDDRRVFEKTLEDAVRNKSPFQMEYRIALPDGTVKRLQSVGRPETTSAGQL